MANILFVHQNFPGQFKHLAPALARSHSVRALVLRNAPITNWQGVTIHPYQVQRGTSPTVHPWVSDFETKVIRADAAFRAALVLKNAGYNPDLVIAHPGWGESLFIKEVWPNATLGIYCEFFYHANGADVGFDPEFPPADCGNSCRLRLKNLNSLLHFETADAGLAPTQWQANTFPLPFRHQIRVIHDGIDTNTLIPNAQVSVTLNGQLTLTRHDEVITFVNRNLEPYRGYHQFMRALPELLQRRPAARVLIVGNDGVSYGAAPPAGQTWKNIFIQEVRPRIPDHDWARVHFLGSIPYPAFIALLQLSRVHVYLTYPFVLSWSLLEAMSVGCAIVASDTAPLREVIQPANNTGRLVDFFDQRGLIEMICTLLNDAALRDQLGQQARLFAQTHYDLTQVCLPQQLAWVNELLS
ncbi:glycosyltransferase [Thiospirillum jenense]|uniref:Glycosyltransferase n=1 Tax=Thiospirillum jenense TaxID=1653858 RepID=A0A839HBC2_9GAMM|nr:glycosyltransferase [Thiospirillum jenense]MBB1125884.1 glycosyltransferase [Thiospirillum jenense]